MASATPLELTDTEIAGLSVTPLSAVVNTAERLGFLGIKDDKLGRWQSLDSLYSKHFDALCYRLRIVKTLNVLWVSRPRNASNGPQSQLEESGCKEIDLRVRFFDWFDEIIVGTPMDCIQEICLCLTRLNDQWKTFQCPQRLRMPVLARLWRLTVMSTFFWF